MTTSWNEMTRKEQLEATHYDMYKDVHGIRPRWIDYSLLSETALEAMLDQLAVELDATIAREKELEAEAIASFEKHVADVVASGAKDDETALRWIMDASDANGDWEYLCYLNGLPYGYFQKAA